MHSDRFVPASIGTLFKYIREFEKTGVLFGIPSELFFTLKSGDSFTVKRYGQTLETPLGVAAGPHTQLSQNIISAWLTGARYMELKTVQVLDELNITKPCIDISDEGYNCEWSQELKLGGSFDEYLNAWIFLHILKDILGYDRTENGFIFNMSVGYNMKGILSPAVQKFLDRMQSCPHELEAKINEAAAYYPAVKNLNISPNMTNSLTVSTMHGCPPDEVEKIGRYFIEERKLDTTIKLNPTLLGPDRLREILNGRLGFETEVPDLAFEHDFKYEQAVSLIKSLQKSSDKSGAAFNLKLTNTLETSNRKQKLPKNEQMVYMSGRALHPISINVAAKLQREFGGKLDISFSAGADCFNITDILKCGLTPVTICTDILKPGGYGRLAQYMEEIREDFKGADPGYLEKYAEDVLDNDLYKKHSYPYESVKTPRELGFFDCAAAPCMSGCPAGQDIPRYLEYTARGEFEKAYKVISATNPFPNVQGRVCDHVCQTKCTRINYDKPLLIREIKRYIADRFERNNIKPSESNGRKVSIIGAGPAGLSCAALLAMEGFTVDVYEAKGFAGGMAADGIPVFRLDDGSLGKDIDNILALGVKIHYNTPVSEEMFAKLREESDFVYVAAGAQKDLPLNIEGIGAEGVYDQLTFLSRMRRGEATGIGSKIIIIGAGNSAMDAARTAKRMTPDGEVSIVYRRTRREMPCDAEEVRGAVEEGIRIVELASPEAVISDGRVTGLKVSRMKLGEPDESGRAGPMKIESSEYVIEADTIITAIGQQVELDFFPEDALRVNPDTYETQIENVYAGGDAYRGASSLINAIADGQKAAASIMAKAGANRVVNLPPDDDRKINKRALMVKQARRDFGVKLPEKPAGERLNFDLFMETLTDADAKAEASRCLQCDIVCNVCTTVCPNRSNFFIETAAAEIPDGTLFTNGSLKHKEPREIKQTYQIINIGDFCNECGNCTTFCPSAGRPFMDKPKFHISKESFDNADFGFHISGDTMHIKTADGISEMTETDSAYIYRESGLEIKLDKKNLMISRVIRNNIPTDKEIGYIPEYAYLFKNVKLRAPFAGV